MDGDYFTHKEWVINAQDDLRNAHPTELSKIGEAWVAADRTTNTKLQNSTWAKYENELRLKTQGPASGQDSGGR